MDGSAPVQPTRRKWWVAPTPTSPGSSNTKRVIDNAPTLLSDGFLSRELWPTHPIANIRVAAQWRAWLTSAHLTAKQAVAEKADPREAAAEKEVEEEPPSEAAAEKEVGAEAPSEAAAAKEVEAEPPSEAAAEKEVGAEAPSEAAAEKEVGAEAPSEAATETPKPEFESVGGDTAPTPRIQFAQTVKGVRALVDNHAGNARRNDTTLLKRLLHRAIPSVEATVQGSRFEFARYAAVELKVEGSGGAPPLFERLVCQKTSVPLTLTYANVRVHNTHTHTHTHNTRTAPTHTAPTHPHTHTHTHARARTDSRVEAEAHRPGCD